MTRDRHALHWRKKQVATPKFVLLSKTHSFTGNVKGAVTEDTSNEAYFFRHYRAEAREKLFYEKLFSARERHQQQQQQTKTESGDEKEKGEVLALPKLPEGPWTFKLGPEYDKRPAVPGNVTHRPRFNYTRPNFKKGEEWVMPKRLIRRTDYGNVNNLTLTQREGKKEKETRLGSRNRNRKRRRSRSKSEGDSVKEKGKEGKNVGKTKKELIALYQQLRKHEKAQKQKQKSKHKGKTSAHRKSIHKRRHSQGTKTSHHKGPVDVRSLLAVGKQ